MEEKEIGIDVNAMWNNILSTLNRKGRREYKKNPDEFMKKRMEDEPLVLIK